MVRLRHDLREQPLLGAEYRLTGIAVTWRPGRSRKPPGPDSIADETVWTDLADPNLTPYRRSKLLAKRAAWDFIAGTAARRS
jgi:hypothetical protein